MNERLSSSICTIQPATEATRQMPLVLDEIVLTCGQLVLLRLIGSSDLSGFLKIKE